MSKKASQKAKSKFIHCLSLSFPLLTSHANSEPMSFSVELNRLSLGRANHGLLHLLHLRQGHRFQELHGLHERGLLHLLLHWLHHGLHGLKLNVFQVLGLVLLDWLHRVTYGITLFITSYEFLDRSLTIVSPDFLYSLMHLYTSFHLLLLLLLALCLVFISLLLYFFLVLFLSCFLLQPSLLLFGCFIASNAFAAIVEADHAKDAANATKATNDDNSHDAGRHATV